MTAGQENHRPSPSKRGPLDQEETRGPPNFIASERFRFKVQLDYFINELFLNVQTFIGIFVFPVCCTC